MSDPFFVATAVASNPTRQAWADRFGMLASIGCAIHCAAMPLLLAYLPSLGLAWLADEGFHRWMAALCFALASAAFVPGWRKHRSLVPAVWGAAGLLLLTVAAFGFAGDCCSACSNNQTETATASACSDTNCPLCKAETPPPVATSSALSSAALGGSLLPLVTPFGGLLLVVGHVVNHRKTCLCHGSHCCPEALGAESVE
jgi:hypothetical protein